MMNCFISSLFNTIIAYLTSLFENKLSIKFENSNSYAHIPDT